MNPSQVARRGARYLERHEVESPRATAEVLLASVLGTDRAGLNRRSSGLSAAEARAYGRALCRRCTGTPAQHLTGVQGFRRLELTVRPGVFVPRPETEVVVEVALAALERLDDPVVVDVGTGSGAIALAVADERPDAIVWATDRSGAAAALAEHNARALGLTVRVREGDLLGPLPPELRGAVDLVVANPPYVPADAYEDLPREVRADPRDALVGGTDLYRRLGREARAWLRPGAAFVVEIGETMAPDVRLILRDERFEGLTVHADLAGRARVVRAIAP